MKTLKKVLIFFGICIAVGFGISFCMIKQSENELNKQPVENNKVKSILDDYVNSYEEIEWIISDNNNAYVGYKDTSFARVNMKGLALECNRATDFGFHVWAIDSKKYSKESVKPATAPDFAFAEVTARNGKIE